MYVKYVADIIIAGNNMIIIWDKNCENESPIPQSPQPLGIKRGNSIPFTGAGQSQVLIVDDSTNTYQSTVRMIHVIIKPVNFFIILFDI